MKNKIYIFSALLVLSACGGGSDNKDTQFYKKQESVPEKLEVSIEASGVIEAISSVEIKSKASGEVLFLGAEVGDFVDKGFMLAQIDQRTANNIVDQTKSDLEAANVRLLNAESQYERGIELNKQSSISDKDFEDTMIGGGKSSSLKNPTLFFEKMFEHDETLFPKKSDSRFNAYSRSCPPNYKRQPVMLTEKEFIDISNNHPDSFYGYIKYGSSPDKEAYYICPRYWCLKTQTSLSKKEIFEENKCGGKDAIIPYDKIPKTIEDLPAGKSIYEFYHDVEHGDGKKNIQIIIVFIIQDLLNRLNTRKGYLCLVV